MSNEAAERLRRDVGPNWDTLNERQLNKVRRILDAEAE